MEFNFPDSKEEKDAIIQQLKKFNKTQIGKLKVFFEGRKIKYLRPYEVENNYTVGFQSGMTFWFFMSPRGRINMDSKRIIK